MPLYVKNKNFLTLPNNFTFYDIEGFRVFQLIFNFALRRCQQYRIKVNTIPQSKMIDNAFPNLSTTPFQLTSCGLDASTLLGLPRRPQARGRAGLGESPLGPLGRDLDGAQLGVDLGTGVVEGRVDGRAVDGRVLAAAARAAQLGQVGSSFLSANANAKGMCFKEKKQVWVLDAKSIAILEWWNGGIVGIK